MSNVRSRLGLLALAIALVLVPTIARARQHVEHRDATRLSIKHSWLGVAPPTKAFVAPEHTAVLPVAAPDSEQRELATHSLVVANPAPRPVLHDSRDPLRGPPSASLVK
jgi:hypothetical protein